MIRGETDYRALLAAIPDKLIELNDAFLSMTGFRRSRAAGRTPQELGVLEYAIEPEFPAEAVRKRRTVRDFPGQINTKTGDLLDVLATATQIELEGNRFRTGHQYLHDPPPRKQHPDEDGVPL